MEAATSSIKNTVKEDVCGVLGVQVVGGSHIILAFVAI